MRRPTPRDIARRLTPAPLRRRLERVFVADAGHGFDPFGMEQQWVMAILGLTRPLYERWFRVTSHHPERIPTRGAAILAANHSGTLPFDAFMLWHDVVRQTDPPRVPRMVLDHFVNLLPFVSVLFSRAGAVGGSRGNLHALLEGGELVGLFPEGVAGVGKPFADRYRLQRWTEGHVEMSIRHRAPVVPVGIVGAEEQMPQLGRLPIHAFGAPYLPVTPVPFPLPVHYHVHYGEPIALHARFPDPDDPEALSAGARLVRDAVQRLLDAGRAGRPGVFR